MAVPKRKKSKAKSRGRRAEYLKLRLPNLGVCSSCGTSKPAHTVCPACGYYKNKIVINYTD